MWYRWHWCYRISTELSIIFKLTTKSLLSLHGQCSIKFEKGQSDLPWCKSYSTYSETFPWCKLELFWPWNVFLFFAFSGSSFPGEGDTYCTCQMVMASWSHKYSTPSIGRNKSSIETVWKSTKLKLLQLLQQPPLSGYWIQKEVHFQSPKPSLILWAKLSERHPQSDPSLREVFTLPWHRTSATTKTKQQFTLKNQQPQITKLTYISFLNFCAFASQVINNVSWVLWHQQHTSLKAEVERWPLTSRATNTFFDTPSMSTQTDVEGFPSQNSLSWWKYNFHKTVKQR